MVLALAAMLIPSAVFASDTIVNVNWSGSGTVTGSGVVGSGWNGPGTSFSESSFATSGNTINGNYCVDTQGKATYDVWGDLGPTTTSQITASVANGGFAEFQNQKTGVTPYGLNQHYDGPGALVFSYVASNDGTVSMAVNSKTNYAHMANYLTSCTATGVTTGFNLQNWLMDTGSVTLVSGSYNIAPTGNYANFAANGVGDANIKLGLYSSVSYYAKDEVDFGFGSGCYTDSKATFNGSGTFTETAVGTNGITVPGDSGNVPIPGNGTWGSCAYNVTYTYATGGTPWTLNNISIKVK
jgi:hypothetical protein